MYAGEITRVHDDGTYNIRYDDGDEERYVEARRIKKGGKEKSGFEKERRSGLKRLAMRESPVRSPRGHDALSQLATRAEKRARRPARRRAASGLRAAPSPAASRHVASANWGPSGPKGDPGVGQLGPSLGPGAPWGPFGTNLEKSFPKSTLEIKNGLSANLENGLRKPLTKFENGL